MESPPDTSNKKADIVISPIRQPDFSEAGRYVLTPGKATRINNVQVPSILKVLDKLPPPPEKTSAERKLEQISTITEVAGYYHRPLVLDVPYRALETKQDYLEKIKRNYNFIDYPFDVEMTDIVDWGCKISTASVLAQMVHYATSRDKKELIMSIAPALLLKLTSDPRPCIRHFKTNYLWRVCFKCGKWDTLKLMEMTFWMKLDRLFDKGNVFDGKSMTAHELIGHPEVEKLLTCVVCHAPRDHFSYGAHYNFRTGQMARVLLAEPIDDT
jgi:hypothetical protein